MKLSNEVILSWEVLGQGSQETQGVTNSQMLLYVSGIYILQVHSLLLYKKVCHGTVLCFPMFKGMLIYFL